jgi:hypothetical protein
MKIELKQKYTWLNVGEVFDTKNLNNILSDIPEIQKYKPQNIKVTATSKGKVLTVIIEF